MTCQLLVLYTFTHQDYKTIQERQLNDNIIFTPKGIRLMRDVIKSRKNFCRDFIKQILFKVASLIERLQVNIQSQFSIDFETETTTF